MYKEINNVTQSNIRFKAEQIKRALFENEIDIIVKKATRIGSSIYLNMTGVIEDNTFYIVRKDGDNIILTKIDLEELVK